MEPATALFGIACLATCAIVRDDRRMAMALALTELWAVANLGWYVDTLAVMPMLDLFLGMLAGTLGWGTRWGHTALALTSLRLAAHVGYGLTGAYLPYSWTLNATFAAHIINIGGRDVRSHFDRLRDSLRRLVVRTRATA